MIKLCNNILCILFLLSVEERVANASERFGAEMKKEHTTADVILEKKDSHSHHATSHQAKRVLIYKHSECDECEDVKRDLKHHNIECQDIDLTWNRKQKMILQRKAGKDDSSYVFIGNEYIGNHDALKHLMHSGKLLRMLQGDE